MGLLLQNKDYGTTPLQRLVAKGIKRCSFQGIKEFERKPDESGNVNSKSPLSRIQVSLSLEEPAKTTDGDDVAAGFPVTVSIQNWEDRPDEGKAKLRELNLAVLGMERSSKEDVVAKTDAMGGWDALKGRHLLVEFDVRDKKYQEWATFNRVNNGAA